jgi:hypothetical protein
MLAIIRCRTFCLPVGIQYLKIKVYKTIILSVVLYGLLILREERRQRVFENRVLRRIFGSKRDEVTGGVEKIT